MASCKPPAIGGAVAGPAPASAGPCADGSERLPATALCQNEARVRLKEAGGGRPEAPAGCTWVVNELTLPRDITLLYLATRCGDRVTALKHAPGERLSLLTYDWSARDGEALRGQTVATMLDASEAEPVEALLALAREAHPDAAEAARCVVAPANAQGWPADALVVTLPAGAAPPVAPVTHSEVCGPYGHTTDAQRYWRVVDGVAFHFNLGQDTPEVDPGSFTLVRRDPSGGAPG
jgi:hypothetical protein